MNPIYSVAIILGLGFLAMFLVKKLIEAVINIIVLHKESKHPDLAKQCHGIVYNTESGKLEADRSLIVPF